MTTNAALLPEMDPVCGMQVNPASAKQVVAYEGRNFYFCCAACREKFQATPEKYLLRSEQWSLGQEMASPTPPLLTLEGSLPVVSAVTQVQKESRSTLEQQSAAYVCPMCPEVRQDKGGACPSCGMALEADVPQTPRTEYTCPMHPEVVRSRPGSCPICGMALEPRTVTVEAENPELRDMTRRFWVSLALTAPLLMITMGGMIWQMSLSRVLPGDSELWVELGLASPVVLWGGFSFFERFWRSLVNRSPNMFTLIGLGTGVAYLYSLAATMVPRLFPESMRSG
ncbi:MAG TPA: heavy metal-binding domain-containing protein, partial [Candidatus Sulfotelmatobacter sp.]